ncbi:MAG: hypothetical protein RBR69_00615 [Candidatus Cloacimonadaceae bacterium]|nr:hypothetical protein [Candidatus Cloacimonadota bacterium]MDD3103622.1 hypothetical protein [Candidatus Cloacimonadota bacterium]MDY0126625.1 hypothetical protein [Candidatus Cloacimonadaceae bacterium]
MTGKNPDEGEYRDRIFGLPCEGLSMGQDCFRFAYLHLYLAGTLRKRLTVLRKLRVLL